MRNLNEARAAIHSKHPEARVEVSKRAGKRFRVKLPGERPVDFGLWPYSGQGTFLDHGNEELRRNWTARHRAQGLRDGTWNNTKSARYWSRFLW